MKKCLLYCLCLCLLFSLGGCSGFNAAQGVQAGMQLAKAATVSDGDLQNMSKKMRQQQDSQAQIAPVNSAYAKRLANVTEKLTSVNGIPLNYKVYMTNEVNANAAPDGSVRVYSGLMDKMNDDELRFVIGHEIGHVALGHTKKAMQVAYTTAAARQAVGATNSIAGALTSSQLGSLAESFVNNQFSQSQESDADAYSMKFLKENNYNTAAAGSALRKLGDGRSSGLMEAMFSTHPDPLKRAQKMDEQAKVANN